MAERLRDTFVPCAPSRASSSFSSSSPLMRCDRTRHVVTLAFRYPPMISCRCTWSNQLLITINFMTMTSRLRRVHGSVTALVVQCFPSAPSSRAHHLFHGLMRPFASLILCDSGTTHLPAYIPAVPLQSNHHGALILFVAPHRHQLSPALWRLGSSRNIMTQPLAISARALKLVASLSVTATISGLVIQDRAR